MAEYIEREEAFNAVLKLVPKVDDDGYCWVIRGDAATAIDSIPAADVRPVVKAKWVNLTPPEFRTDEESVFWMCSECSNAAVFLAEDLPYNYCPNCGADMREES